MYLRKNDGSIIKEDKMNSTPLSAEKVNCTGTSELRCKTRIGELHKVA